MENTTGFYLIRSRISTFFQHTGPGIVLALIQLFLVFRVIPHVDTTTTIIVGLVLYCVIPGWAGLRMARQRRRIFTGVSAGFVTGMTCAITIILVLGILIAIALARPPTIAPGTRFALPVAFAAAYIMMLALFLNFAGVLLAVIGGTLGGIIGKRWAIRPAESSGERHQRTTSQL